MSFVSLAFALLFVFTYIICRLVQTSYNFV